MRHVFVLFLIVLLFKEKLRWLTLLTFLQRHVSHHVRPVKLVVVLLIVNYVVIVVGLHEEAVKTAFSVCDTFSELGTCLVDITFESLEKSTLRTLHILFH